MSVTLRQLYIIFMDLSFSHLQNRVDKGISSQSAGWGLALSLPGARLDPWSGELRPCKRQAMMLPPPSAQMEVIISSPNTPGLL